MTPRDRLVAVLEGRPADRVPAWLLFPYHPLGCYADVRTNPHYADVFRASLEKAVHLDRRGLSASPFPPDVRRRRETVEEDGWRIRRDVLEFEGRSWTAEHAVREDETRLRRWIENEDDLEAFCRLPVRDDEAALRRELDPQADRIRRETAEFPRDLGAMMLDMGEPIGVLYHASNLTEYPVWSLTHADLIDAFLVRLQAHFRRVYRYALERGLAEVYFLVGSELASPPMVSRATFRRWIVPHARELIGLVRAAGARAIQHYHGQIREVLPDFLEMAPDALHTIEAPPVGNCTLSQAWDAVGDRIALIGNIQYDEFQSLAPDGMRDAVRRVLDEARGRRFILSPTAGPYEDVLSERQQANYLAFLDAAWEFGRIEH
jgi:uroporphyrinogen-III decarboxylase